MARCLSLILTFMLAAQASADLFAQGEVVAQRISATEGNFINALSPGDNFGRSVASLGDLDGDGVVDLVVGAPGDDEAGGRMGALWILFLNPNGTVKNHTKILPPTDFDMGLSFGRSVDTIGDANGDGVPDLAVASDQVLAFVYLDPSAKAIGYKKLFFHNENRREGICHVGDVDNDGSPDLAAGTSTPGGTWVNIFRTGLTFSQGADFGAEIGGQITKFGAGIDVIEQLGDDTTMVLMVGAPGADEGGTNRGAVLLVDVSVTRITTSRNLDPVLRKSVISSESSGLQHLLRNGDGFGEDVSNLGDLDGDGNPDIVVGAPGDEGDGFNQGSVWIVFLSADGTPRASRTIGAGDSEFAIPLSDGDLFGTSVIGIGDLDGDGIEDLAAGAPGNGDEGGLWILFGLPALPSEVELKDLTQTPLLGQDILVEAEISGVSDIQSAELNFRRGGDPTFFSAPMAEDAPGRFSFQIPAFAVDSRGIEYFVTTTNSAGTEVRAPSEGIESIQIVVPDGLDLEVPFGSATEAYRLISFPLELDSTDAGSLLQASLGPYEPSAWRFFALNRQGGTIDVADAAVELAPGASYWLLSLNPNQTLNSGPGISIETGTPFPIRLQQGWTLVGNPFNFQIPLANLTTESGDSIDIRAYDGSWSVHDGFLEPFGGYAVFSNDFDTLWVDADRTPGESAPALAQLPDQSPGSASQWGIRVIATSGRARDTDGFAGVASTASHEWDQSDRPEPPTIGDYLSVYFPHPEWNRTASRFSTDLRSNVKAAHSWTIGVESTTARPVDLRFEQINSIPADLSVWLVDEAAKISHDLRKNPEYWMVGGTPSSPRTVQLVVGPLEGFEVPSARSLGLEIFPNPCLVSTSIVALLPEDARATLRIFDSLGREVARLVDDTALNAGRSVIVWDGLTANGASAAGGFYLARLEAGGKVVSRGLTISN